MASANTTKSKAKKTAVKKPVTKQVGLNYFHDKKWFSDPNTSTIWLRIYSCAFIPWKQYLRVMKKALRGAQYEAPIKIYHTILDGLNYNDLEMSIISSEHGISHITINGGEKKLPKSSYIIFSTPFVINGTPGNEAETRKRLDLLAAVLGMHLGNNYLRDLWVEGIVNAHDSKLQTMGKAFQIPVHIEGPALHPLNWQHSKAIIKKIQTLPAEKRKIPELALTLFERGVRDKTGTKFFYYWVAIEVLCQTNNADVITEKLAIYYKCDKTAIREQLYWKKFFVARHNYFHKGIAPNFNQVLERYAQILFLDLLRGELGMKALRHLGGFIGQLQRDPFANPTPEENAEMSKPRKTISESEQKRRIKKEEKYWDLMIKERKL